MLFVYVLILFFNVIKRLEKQNENPESKKMALELRYRIELLESKIKEMQRFLPSTAGYVNNEFNKSLDIFINPLKYHNIACVKYIDL
jgi:intein/homing endonuclease